jgi:predicted esterase
VCLHGAGGSGEWLQAYVQGLAEAAHVAVLCPTADIPAVRTANLDLAGVLGPRFRHPRWVPALGEFPMVALRWARSKLDVDPDRCAVVGHSMGAIAAWALAMRFGHCFSAVVPISGAVSLWEMFGPDRETEELIPNLLKVPLSVFHGTADEQIPINMSRTIVSKLDGMGHAGLEYTEIVDGGHSLATMQMRPGTPHYDRLGCWLSRQRRQRWPSRITHRAVDENHGRAHWVEVGDIPKGQTASVVGQILSHDVIMLDVSGARQIKLHLHRMLLKPGDISVIINGRSIRVRFIPELSEVVSSFKRTYDPGLLAEQAIILEVENPKEGLNCDA